MIEFELDVVSNVSTYVYGAFNGIEGVLPSVPWLATFALLVVLFWQRSLLFIRSGAR